MSNIQKRAGALALAGSGEFLPVMNEADKFLLSTVSNREKAARVVVIPTASGLELDKPQEWAELGVRHFTNLGVQVQAAMIVQREDAYKPEILQILEDADFYYFSGGNPGYLIETFNATPAWELISKARQNGAVLAGCSAGAMAMSGYTTSIRAAMSGKVEWIKGWGVVPNVVTFPHFDRMAGFIGTDLMKRMLANAPEGCRIIGVDEDTVLVGINSPDDAKYQWRVMGRQTVSVFDNDGKPTIYKADEIVPEL